MIFPKPLFCFDCRFSCIVWTRPFSGTRALREALGGPVAILDHSQPHEDQQAQHLGL